MSNLIEIINESLKKWENPNRHVFAPCSFCRDASEIVSEGSTCAYCQIDHTICDEDGNKGLISEYFNCKSIGHSITVVGDLPEIAELIVGRLKTMKALAILRDEKCK